MHCATQHSAHAPVYIQAVQCSCQCQALLLVLQAVCSCLQSSQQQAVCLTPGCGWGRWHVCKAQE